jgi:hypothetical protein
VDWAVSNTGTADIAGHIDFWLYLDGVVLQKFYTNNGLPAGHYTQVLDYPVPANTTTQGTHTLAIVADPNHLIPETSETDNAWSASWPWSMFYGLAPSGRGGARGEPDAIEIHDQIPIGSEPLEAARAVPQVFYIPAGAHASGVAGTNWRTDVEVHNPGTAQAAYTMALLKHGQDNSAPVSQSFTLGPGLSVRYSDVVWQRFAFSGKAALRLTATAGTIIVTSRTYNDQPGGSYGQFVPAIADEAAITSAQEGRLIELSHEPSAANGGFRTNLGVVNASSGTIGVTVDLYKADGTHLGRVPVTLRPYDYQQLDKIFERVTSTAVTDGYAVVRTWSTSGRFFAYASVIDNHTGDPICIPAAVLPTSQGQIITGPGGTSITLPAGGTIPNAPVTITAGTGTDLPKTGETLVSTVLKVNVGGEGESTGAGPYLVKIPVTGAVSDPNKLLLKVQTSVGSVYPVAGMYDSGSKVFTAEVEALWNGWNMGVVTNDNLLVVPPSGSPGAVHTLGWVTPQSWETCEWRMLVETQTASLSFPGDVQQALERACETLRDAAFRSPKLWIDRRFSPRARTAHIVSGTGEDDPRTSFSQSANENDAEFSMATFNDEQMHSLGQLYFNWDEFQTSIKSKNWSTGNIAIHELLHGVQYGYDIRDKWWQNPSNTWNHALMWLTEGTSTVVGMTYQSNSGSIHGGSVVVRPQEPVEAVNDPMQWPVSVEAYARQDFFAYVAKRFDGNSFAGLRTLYQAVADQTSGQFGKDWFEYLTLYRRGMDANYRAAFGISLPDLYTEFALDRAYRHTEPALLRNADRALAMNSLDTAGACGGKFTRWDPASTPAITSSGAGGLDAVQWLHTWPIHVSVPASAKTAGRLDLVFTVTGAPVDHTGVRIFVFREAGGVMVPGGEMEVTSNGQPVSVPVSSSIDSLTILVVNGTVEDHQAQVKIAVPKVESTFEVKVKERSYVEACHQGDLEHLTSFTVQPGDMTWNGNSFRGFIHVTHGSTYDSYDVNGTLSADRSTLLITKLVAGIHLSQSCADYETVSIAFPAPLARTSSTGSTVTYELSGQGVYNALWTGSDHYNYTTVRHYTCQSSQYCPPGDYTFVLAPCDGSSSWHIKLVIAAP